jgi:hypothetical protein
MNTLRLKWEPENLTQLAEIEQRVDDYTNNLGKVLIMGNGTLLALNKSEQDNDIDVAKKALNEARFLIDFNVMAMKEGGFIISFHKAIFVFVGEKEWEARKEEVQKRQGELMFPGERFFVPPGEPPENVLIGLYARGKLQRDAYHFNFYKRV